MWSIVFVLPNLTLTESFGNEYIAIVPRDDDRVTAVTSTNDTARRLLYNFQDQFGHEVAPAVLIVNDDSPPAAQDIEAIVAFRNTLALAAIIEAHELGIDRSILSHPRYTDYFDFYPTRIATHEDGLLTTSPGVLGFSFNTPQFTGQTAAGLAAPMSLSLGLETDLLKALQQRWVWRFVDGRKSEWKTRYLFRSLEMAYQAASMPFSNHSSLYDFGTAAGLWVSSMEILSRSPRRKANLLSVVTLLGHFDWRNKVIKRRLYRVPYGGRKTSANLSQRLYLDIYRARNAFLHGNPVKPADLYPFRRQGKILITAFAPLLYKVALISFMGGGGKPLGRRPSYRNIARRAAREYKLAEVILKARQRS